jgi:hypothetical protein
MQGRTWLPDLDDSSCILESLVSNVFLLDGCFASIVIELDANASKSCK